MRGEKNIMKHCEFDILRHVDTVVSLSLSENGDGYLATISASRELVDGSMINWNDCWFVGSQDEAKKKAEEITQYIGLDKYYIKNTARDDLKEKEPYYSHLEKQAPPFVMLDVNPLHETEGAILTILEWYNNGEINILVPSTVRKEMHDNIGKIPHYAQNLLNSLFFTVSFELSQFELEQREKFIINTRGNSEPKNIDTDLSHIVEAAKYHARYFITRDNRLMNETRKAKIRNFYTHLSLVTPEEFVEYFQKTL